MTSSRSLTRPRAMRRSATFVQAIRSTKATAPRSTGSPDRDVRRREERPWSYRVRTLRDLLDAPRYAESVQRLEAQRLEDEEVEGSEEVRGVIGHGSYRRPIGGSMQRFLSNADMSVSSRRASRPPPSAAQELLPPAQPGCIVVPGS